jgi:hypothetical protein
MSQVLGIEGKYIYLDSDFLKVLSEDINFAQNIYKILIKNYLVIDNLIRLEFLRDIFIPEQKADKEKFINSNFFQQSILHPEVFTKQQENALLLSKIYKQQIRNTKKNTACHSSPVDLLLAARLMLNYVRELLITGNKKDFPSCIFDIIHIFPYELKQGNIIPFCLIKFNKDKFDKYHKELKEI